jgi:hypothetical protein
VNDTKSKNQNNFISLSEASEKTGYHQDYLGFLCRTGKLEGFKIGRNWVITQSALESFLANNASGQIEAVQTVPVKVIAPSASVPVPAVPTVSQEVEKSKHDLSNLKRKVFEDLNYRIGNLNTQLNELDAKLANSQKAVALPNQVATVSTPVLPAEDLEPKIKPELKTKFASALAVASNLEPEEKTFAPLSVLSKDALLKLKESFRVKARNNFLAPSLAMGVAVLAFVSTVAWNYLQEDLYRNYQTPAVVYKNNFVPESQPASSTPPVIIQNGNQIVIRDRFTTETVVKSLSADANLVNQLIDQRLNKYLAEGKFKGEKGDTGAQGLQGSNGQTVGAGGYVPYAYYAPVPANNFTGGTSLSSTQMSANSGVITTLSVGDITTTGNASIGGTLNVSGNTGLSTANITTLNVAGTSNLATTTISQLNISGNATTTGNLTVLGTFNLSG